jgi:hypothetical protein
VLTHGRVVGHDTDQLLVAGVAGHTVRDVETGSEFATSANGIVVVSDHNRVLRNTGVGYNVGLVVDGHHNLLAYNTGMGQGGFAVVGDDNWLVGNLTPSPGPAFGGYVRGRGNRLHGNEIQGGGDGLLVEGDENRLRQNFVHGDARGLVVNGTANTIVHNTVRSSGTDLVDTQEDCDGNRWAHNVFQTSQAGTTMNPPCIQ